MKKVAIITLNGNFNYGNRLQNFALQEIIRNLGFEVETLINDNNLKNKTDDNAGILKRVREKDIQEIYNGLSKRAEGYIYKDRIKERFKIFKDFSTHHIAETDFSIIENQIPSNLVDKYTYFVTGSDQVWNPHSRKGSSFEFLTFAPPNKRISYAPSFGVAKIPEEYIENYRLWLSEMSYLSVREEAGANIIKQLTERDSTVVLDPTMLLTKEKWLSISKTPSHKPVKGYLLTYFLGNINKDRERKLKRIAEENNLEIVHLAQIKHKKPYLSGPSEFIDYINSAKIFCTDSFHGAVFSILLETPFIVFNREGNSPSMNSRLDTLLKKFNLESRYDNETINNNQLFDINFSDTKILIEAEREKSIKYLREALNVKI